MARITPIRVTKNDRTEYARLVKNTKAKVRRTLKNYGIDLSNDVELPNLESFSTRSEFNEWKQKQSSFTNRNNLNYQFKKNVHGVVASKKRLNEIERDTKRAQNLAEKLQKESVNKPFISGGKVQGTIGQRMLQMGKPNVAGIYRPPDFNFDKIRSYRELNKKEENMRERGNERFFDKRMIIMKTNYINKVKETMNSDGDLLVQKLEGIAPDDFFNMYLQVDEMDFDTFYTMEEGQFRNLADKISMEIDRYFAGEYNTDLKGF